MRLWLLKTGTQTRKERSYENVLMTNEPFLSRSCDIYTIPDISLPFLYLFADSPRRTILDALGDAFDERNIQREKDEDVKEARKSGGLMYMTLVEDSLTKSLSVSYMKKIQTTVISPICMAVRDISSGLPPTARGHPQSGE